MPQERVDIVCVGGGIGGSALATVMARAGHSVLVLEKSTVFKDRVRGEWIAPWGVVETKRLGLYDDLLGAEGHHLGRHVGFGDDVPDAEASLARGLDLTALLPGIPGPLCIRHPRACETLSALAVRTGATVLRGVEGVKVRPGSAPEVTFVHNGVERTVRCRLIVGADGRTGTVRQQVGIVEQRDPTHHLFSGMLVEGAEGWPEDVQTKGTEGEVNFLAFPQGKGRVRLYLGYSYERKSLLSGPDAQQVFLQQFRLKSVPFSDAIVNSTPISHCFSYPNEDTWCDTPYGDGLVLIGDAAGHNDPIIGQGLSITFRDVRLVTDLLLGEKVWGAGLFAPYAEERRERMRRLRFSASLMSVLDCEFGPEAEARRKRVTERRRDDPTLGLFGAASMVGPENIPDFVFTPSYREKVLA